MQRYAKIGVRVAPSLLLVLGRKRECAFYSRFEVGFSVLPDTTLAKEYHDQVY